MKRILAGAGVLFPSWSAFVVVARAALAAPFECANTVGGDKYGQCSAF